MEFFSHSLLTLYVYANTELATYSSVQIRSARWNITGWPSVPIETATTWPKRKSNFGQSVTYAERRGKFSKKVINTINWMNVPNPSTATNQCWFWWIYRWQIIFDFPIGCRRYGDINKVLIGIDNGRRFGCCRF